MLLRFDPFREFDRLSGSVAAFRGSPLDVYRRGDEYVIELDLPGLQPDSIDLTIERGVLQVTAERKPTWGDGDQVLVAERPRGSVRRQVQLTDDIDDAGVRADYHDGVLTIHVPVADEAKPHRIPIAAGSGQKTLTAQAN